ncbi:hypothetical protein [Arthrobacter sp. SLBN-112]|uniref:hypothetical protein n=1 Tax=Arthrobacter sp. SLBN-112 TaxID=2768452 RepID=UPI00114F4125|nr:hypothetical protein [Arthrobacter sp. SLBN-112]
MLCSSCEVQPSHLGRRQRLALPLRARPVTGWLGLPHSPSRQWGVPASQPGGGQEPAAHDQPTQEQFPQGQPAQGWGAAAPGSPSPGWGTTPADGQLPNAAGNGTAAASTNNGLGTGATGQSGPGGQSGMTGQGGMMGPGGQSGVDGGMAGGTGMDGGPTTVPGSRTSSN